MAVQRAPVPGAQAMPTGLRRPDAKTREGPPSGLNSRIAARRASSRLLTFDSEPTLTYIFVPAALKSTPRVECPFGGRSARKVGDVLRGAVRFRVAGLVREADHAVLVADVEESAMEGQPERLVESPGVGEVLLAAEDGDAPSARLGHEHVAVRREQHRARVLEPAGEDGRVKDGRESQ